MKDIAETLGKARDLVRGAIIKLRTAELLLRGIGYTLTECSVLAPRESAERAETVLHDCFTLELEAESKEAQAS